MYYIMPNNTHAFVDHFQTFSGTCSFAYIYITRRRIVAGDKTQNRENCPYADGDRTLQNNNNKKNKYFYINNNISVFFLYIIVLLLLLVYVIRSRAKANKTVRQRSFI